MNENKIYKFYYTVTGEDNNNEVHSWSKTLSYILGQFGISVNNVLPGATSTVHLSSILESKARKLGKSVFEIESAMVAEIPATTLQMHLK